jgi:hypothetical protein
MEKDQNSTFLRTGTGTYLKRHTPHLPSHFIVIKSLKVCYTSSEKKKKKEKGGGEKKDEKIEDED